MLIFLIQYISTSFLTLFFRPLIVNHEACVKTLILAVNLNREFAYFATM